MGKIAVLFAGQGAQYEGMGKDFLTHSPAAEQVFQTADSIRPGTSVQCTTAPKEELGVTINTQPCLFCADLAAAAALKEAGVKADMAAGFSLGEIPALAFAGLLDTREAFRFVVRRGILMDEAARAQGGGMLAVLKLDAAAVEALCADIPGCWPVNYNCPGQTVISCREDALPTAEAAVKAQGGRSVRLAVSGAFHSPLMDSAAQALREEFSSLRFQTPALPLYANVTGDVYENEEQLFRQVNSPVRWQAAVERMAQAGADTFIEVGPGKTLTGLTKKILPGARAFSVQDTAGLQAVLEVL